jgi:hypothetical protein
MNHRKHLMLLAAVGLLSVWPGLIAIRTTLQTWRFTASSTRHPVIPTDPSDDVGETFIMRDSDLDAPAVR